ncbi:class I mannose-6-phosphate isomerase [Blastomonas sp. AAP53]|uniref:class I mannose-6-phosphate isomerase n=1 Tax=Blastomonas sp. AAP53 TaxID=1248760 RepID=UPI00030C437E|nr:class I mannose-6-phosphate isomerase [Blastomonas sp. AAP53]
MISPATAIKLATRHVAKPWGRTSLPQPFDKPGSERIGEIWFEPDADLVLPLMVKYIFTSEKLSIQVHPDDGQARERGSSSGKEECWLVLDAEPGARLGIGTQRALSAPELREAALHGEIEALMDWKPVARGDFYYIPAGTVHAIGAGISLIEVQQNADITYRLYDYGRPRELHLDDGVAVSNAVPYADALHRTVDFAADQMLVDGPHFRLMLTGNATADLEGYGPVMVVPVEGSVEVAEADGMIRAEAGECLAVAPGAQLHASADARLLLARACKGADA